MAKRAHAYPSVDLTAVDLINASVARLPAGCRVGAALAIARRRNAPLGALAAGRAGYVLREDLRRASALGLDDITALRLTRRLPRVAPRAGEVTVRRHLAAGAPAAVVEDRRGPLGAILVVRGDRGPASQLSMAARLTRRLPPATLELLRSLGALAAAQGGRAFAVGGLVRDAWRDATVATGRDLDIVVEGDAPALARALATSLGAAVLEHPRFLTASVTGTPCGRVDIATARSERYDVPGALPRVMPAGIAQDLGRRDFGVNAMAVELASGAFGLLDPFGGRSDLARRRLRVLHPLSLVEDPTRILRAARYAARLGFAEDADTVRARTLALGLVPYAALSPQRIAAELERILVDDRADVALGRLGRTGAFRLLDRRYRFTRAAARRVEALPATLAWARARDVAVVPLEVLGLALAADQDREVGDAVLRRLGFAGEPLARLARTLDGWRTLAGAMAAARAPSQRARLLRDGHATGLAWLWTVGDPALRAALDAFVGRERRETAELGGEDVIALGVPRGPAVARVLSEVRDARLDGEVGDRAAEVEYVRRWVRRAGSRAQEVPEKRSARKEG